MLFLTKVVFPGKKVSHSCSFMAITNLFCLMLGGMETLETSKPDLVFDGELDFEKGVMFIMHNYVSLFLFIGMYVFVIFFFTNCFCYTEL